MCLGSQKLSFDASIEVFVFALKFNVINCFLSAFDIKPHVKQTSIFMAGIMAYGSLDFCT